MTPSQQIANQERVILELRANLANAEKRNAQQQRIIDRMQRLIDRLQDALRMKSEAEKVFGNG